MAASDKAVEYMKRRKAAMYALVLNVAKQAEGDMRQHAPWKDRTAHARQALHTGVKRSGDKIVMSLAHGTVYGSYLETGTGLHGPKKQAYEIKPSSKKALRWAGPAGPVYARKVKHPGIKPRPIVEPTARKYKVILRNAARKLWGAT